MSNDVNDLTNDLIIQVAFGEIGGQRVQVCDGRDLHHYLGVQRDFTTWIKKRIEEYGFVENEDYAVCRIKLNPQNGGITNGRGGDRKTMIYTLSLDMAKELAMVAKNDAGKRVRRYFIDCERRAMGMGEISTESSVDAGTNLSELEAELCRPSSFREALESTVLYWTLDKHNLIDYPQIPREVVWGVTKDINRSIRRDIYLDILAKFGAAAVRACDPEIISYLFQWRPGYARVRNHVS